MRFATGWKQSNFPNNSASFFSEDYDLLEGVMDESVSIFSTNRYVQTLTWTPPLDHKLQRIS
jgi:hypothetical protein